MDFNQELNEMGRISMPLCNKIINTDISEDYTLPDYNPEIRRVLYVKETLMVPAKFINGNKLDINGVIDYTLVYISGDMKLCSIPISSEYAFSITLDNVSDFEMSEGFTVMAHSICDGSTVRVLSPRKLQIRSHVRSNVNAWGKKACEERIEGINDPTSIQRSMQDGICSQMICENSDVVSLEDEYVLPDENYRVSLADSSVNIKECRIDGELVRINGDAIVKMTIMNEDGNNKETVIRKIPFEAESDVIGMDIDGGELCRVSGVITDLSLNVIEGKVMTEANLVLEVCMGQNAKITYTKDIYSTDQKVKTLVSKEKMPYVVLNKNFNMSQSDRVGMNEINFSDESEILDACASASVDEMISENGKFVMRGSCKYNIICQKDGDYSYCEARVPFKYEGECSGDIDSFDATVNVMNCKARKDGEYISLDGELCISCTAMGVEEVEMLDCATFGEEIEKSKNEWVVCYLQGCEDVWNIAKRHSVRPQDISGDPSKDRFVMIEK